MQTTKRNMRGRMKMNEEKIGMNNCEAMSQEKSQNLSESIDYIQTVFDRVSGLADRINGTKLSTGVDSKPEPPQPSLSDVLSSGGDNIRDKCDAIHDRLALIENLLF